MASPPPPPPNPNGFASSSPFDPLFLQGLMSRLHLQNPNPDPLLSLALELSDDDEELDLDLDLDDDDDHEELDLSSASGRRKLLADEEAGLEKEIIRIVLSGDAMETLKPNTGRSVAVGEHSVCVGLHEEPGEDYRVWEWHGHVMVFDDEEGYSAEYVYGNYFERLVGKKERKKDDVGGSMGLRDLIEGLDGSVGGESGRVLHRNSLNGGAGRGNGQPPF